MGWGVYDYPSAPEKEEQTVSGTISVTYKFEMDVPKKWDKEDMLDDIRANIDEYIYGADMTIEDIDI